MASPENRETQVNEFCTMCGTSPENATRYLEAHNWDMLSACNAYFQDADEEAAEETQPSQTTGASASATNDNYTGPRTLDGRPAPHAVSGSSSQQRSAPKKRGIATLRSTQSQRPDDDDEDDEEDDEDAGDRGDLFAGGEKSGLAVRDPKQEGGPRKIISDILAKAKANASRQEPEDDAGPSRQSFFRGNGMTLGGEGVESRSIPDPQGSARPSNAQPQERVLHIWQDGFSVDDGELRRFDDPANQMDLQMIRSGRAPLHLMNVENDQPVDVKLHQHETPYKPQPKQYRPFGGAGQRLGAPVPGDGSATASPSASTSTTQAPAAAAAEASSPSGAVQLDSSQPTITIRVQLPDGARVPARFNPTHTIGDIYAFVESSAPVTRTRTWVLATTFPNKEHVDKESVLGDMAEFKKGGTAVVKWT